MRAALVTLLVVCLSACTRAVPVADDDLALSLTEQRRIAIDLEEDHEEREDDVQAFEDDDDDDDTPVSKYTTVNELGLYVTRDVSTAVGGVSEEKHAGGGTSYDAEKFVQDFATKRDGKVCYNEGKEDEKCVQGKHVYKFLWVPRSTLNNTELAKILAWLLQERALKARTACNRKTVLSGFGTHWESRQYNCSTSATNDTGAADKTGQHSFLVHSL